MKIKSSLSCWISIALKGPIWNHTYKDLATELKDQRYLTSPGICSRPLIIQFTEQTGFCLSYFRSRTGLCRFQASSQSANVGVILSTDIVVFGIQRKTENVAFSFSARRRRASRPKLKNNRDLPIPCSHKE